MSGTVRLITDQAYAALQALTPRPTDQDLGTVATANRLAATAVAATDAEHAAAASMESIGAAIREFAARAAPAEAFRATLDAQNAALSTELPARLARLQRIRALVDAQKIDILAVIPVGVWATQLAASNALRDLPRLAHDADDALRRSSTGTLADQEAAVTTAYGVPLAAAAAANQALGEALESLAELGFGLINHQPRFNEGFIPIAKGLQQGIAAYQTLETQGVDMLHAFCIGDAFLGAQAVNTVAGVFPATVSEEILVDVLRTLVDYATKNSGDHDCWSALSHMAVNMAEQYGFYQPRPPSSHTDSFASDRYDS
ncbi:hypothetical protein ACFQ9X_38385 [Catenulispora yoronensis]